MVVQIFSILYSDSLQCESRIYMEIKESRRLDPWPNHGI